MVIFNKLLIANRGEIACRIIRTAKRLGIATVAIFSEVDSNALHVKLADEAYLIGPAASKESYLNIAKIISIAKQAVVDAIHPGYGFLSENEAFAQSCEQENIVFIGPNASAINLMGNKNIAKKIMEQHGVPILPGYYDETHSLENLLSAANKIGFPVVLKAVAGGGGKGLRVVHQEQDFEHAYMAVRREAKAFFNDDKVLLEKYLLNTRHVEVQILADHYGEVVPLFTRDCSIQRRHQKILEEAPAPNLEQNFSQQLLAAGVQAAKAINYTNAGTIEFLVTENAFYFMEMNTRLQVEHPVTEMITGIDLVEWQLRIAAKEKLTELSYKCSGHAIEVRLNAEDPEKDFLPSAGKLEYFHFPKNEHAVRIDSGYHIKDVINIYYDSLLAKIIVWAENRSLAIQRLLQVLNNTFLFGIKTNLPLLKIILHNEAFRSTHISTHFLQTELLTNPVIIPKNIFALSGLFLLLKNEISEPRFSEQDPYSPWHQHDGWQLFFSPQLTTHFLHQHDVITINFKKREDHYDVTLDEKLIKCSVIDFHPLTENIYQLDTVIGSQYYSAKFCLLGSKLEVIANSQYYYLEIPERDYAHHPLEEEQPLLAPMPGTLVALYVNAGQKVAKGDKLLVIEAMKMEHTVFAPREGMIKECYYQLGDLIKEGSELIAFEAVTGTPL